MLTHCSNQLNIEKKRCEKMYNFEIGRGECSSHRLNNAGRLSKKTPPGNLGSVCVLYQTRCGEK